jgi:hypothetical protein
MHGSLAACYACHVRDAVLCVLCRSLMLVITSKHDASGDSGLFVLFVSVNLPLSLSFELWAIISQRAPLATLRELKPSLAHLILTHSYRYTYR